MINLIVVVDPDYGARLQMAVQRAPVWVVATAANQAACERLWNAHPTGDHRDKGALTCYQVHDAEDRLAGLLNVLPTLEEHHGEVHDNRLSFPHGFLLQVIGLTPADSVTNALRAFGFSSFFPIAGGFQACK